MIIAAGLHDVGSHMGSHTQPVKSLKDFVGFFPESFAFGPRSEAVDIEREEGREE